MQLLITTQIQENYGAHDWDGEGACPQYWKFKGGMITSMTWVRWCVTQTPCRSWHTTSSSTLKEATTTSANTS